MNDIYKVCMIMYESTIIQGAPVGKWASNRVGCTFFVNSDSKLHYEHVNA